MAVVTITTGGTYYFNNGDTYIISPTVSGTVTFRPNAGTADNLNVEFQQSNTNTVNIVTEDYLLRGEFNVNLTVKDGVTATNTSLNAVASNNVVASIGANSTFGNITASDDNGDSLKLTAADGAKVGNILSGGNALGIESGGNDTITLGNNVTAGTITTRAGNDILQVGTNSTIGAIDTGGGNDTISLGSGTKTGNIITFDGDDSVTLASNVTTGSLNVGDGSDKITMGNNNTVGAITLGSGGTNGDIINTGTGNTITGSITQSTDDSYSRLIFGAGTTITGGISLEGGKDTVVLGDSSSVGQIVDVGHVTSADDNDVLTLGNNVTLKGGFQTEEGGDTVTIGLNPVLSGTTDMYLDNTGSDSMNIALRKSELAAFKAAMNAAGFTDANGDGTYEYTGSILNPDAYDFTWNGKKFTDVELVSFFFPCFARGTLIETDRGAVAIEELTEGDLVMTRDNGLQPIRWIGNRALSAEVLFANDKLRPIRIRAGALGRGLPTSDLLVSPQHRVLVRSHIAQKMFGAPEVLVAAKQLCQIDGIDIAYDMASVEYFHMLFDRHEVVISNGAETESLFTGPEALKAVGPAAAEEIFAIFPELRDRDYTPVAARPLVSGRMGRKLAVRHAQNGKMLIG